MRNVARAGDRVVAMEVLQAGVDRGQTLFEVLDQLELSDRAHARHELDRLHGAPGGVDLEQAIAGVARHLTGALAPRDSLELYVMLGVCPASILLRRAYGLRSAIYPNLTGSGERSPAEEVTA